MNDTWYTVCTNTLEFFKTEQHSKHLINNNRSAKILAEKNIYFFVIVDVN